MRERGWKGELGLWCGRPSAAKADIFLSRDAPSPSTRIDGEFGAFAFEGTTAHNAFVGVLAALCVDKAAILGGISTLDVAVFDPFANVSDHIVKSVGAAS